MSSTRNNDLTPARSEQSDDDEAWDQYPVENPGIEPHVERYTDVNKAAGDRAYRKVITMFALVPILAILFVVVYFAVPKDAAISLLGTDFKAQTLLFGLTGGLAVLLIGVAAVTWARDIMGDHEISEERHPAGTDPADRKDALAMVNAGVSESNVGRRKLLLGGLGGALGIVAVPAIVLFADMGPWPVKAVRRETIERTIWAEGVRLVNDVTYRPLKASDLEIGQLVNAEPENLKDLHSHEQLVEKAKSAIVIVRMDPHTIKIPDSRKDWQVGGILAYSKICTHVGCPISLWEQQTHHLLCPCHQSTFDLGNSGVVVFGPAARSLPQLPITTDSEGYLIARSGFTVPVAPSYFERDSRNDYKDGDR
ncbi:cytochrome bc1 complex Rieske iron-sulfur subunit [Nigerium massiliense]|uniref:cytochrome bc1 complex Rieske iron-sulfur subunit n=1 Tax=Nigerium massiliense TaxID=1522317 RepID=UPI0009E3F04A|nr:Rieske 2Fe-2S domain-containing protein [Nigerium massiliense]